MQLIINTKKVDNPLAVAALSLFAMCVIAAVLSLILFVVLPLIGLFVSGILAVLFIVITPIIFWFVLPALMLSIIAWCFGRFLK
jgi:hypothetical protein